MSKKIETDADKRLARNKLFELPVERDNSYYPDYVSNTLKKSISVLEKLKGRQKDEYGKISSSYECLVKSISNAIKVYYQGSPVEAYHLLKEGLDTVNLIPDIMEHSQRVMGAPILPEDGYFSLFRARTKDDNKQFSKKDLFHVPFELRYKVATQRYSIPGLPCLYLSNSTYACWEEVGRPDINNLFYSRFEYHPWKLKILDLTWLHPILVSDLFYERESPASDLIDNESDILLNVQFQHHILKWPLKMASSISVMDRKAHFKPEYIIPQLLLQWVSQEKKFDGIKYNSTRTAKVGTTLGSHVNYVFPAKEIAQEGYCSTLTINFKCTEPLSWQIATMSEPGLYSEIVDQEYFDKIWFNGLAYTDYPPLHLELTKGQPALYFNTIFGRLERQLRKLQSGYVN